MTIYRPGDELPGGHYQMIVADPPWTYEDIQSPNKVKYLAEGNYMGFEYMTTDAICAMPIKDLADKDAMLAIWTTSQMLICGDVLRVIKAWDFKPKSLHTWIKIGKNGRPRIITGHYGRGTTEHFIIATRGHPDISEWRTAPAIPTSHMWPFQTVKARKPEESYSLFERVSPGWTRLELFARLARPGWDQWGDQTQEVNQLG